MEPILLFLPLLMATCEVLPTEATAPLNLAQGRRPQTSSSSSSASSSSSSSSVASIGGPPMRFPPKVSGFVVVSEGNYDHEHHTHTHGALETHRVPSPQFVTNNTTTTEVYLGATAKLDCTVDDLTNESVSWLRRVDDVLELITWEEHTYSKDSRYSLDHDSGDKWQQWQLIIQNVQSGDAGQYRCQVATQPPMVLNAQLKVIEPRVRVVDERGTKVVEKHYNSGSMIELKCVIEFVPFPHGPVTWRRGNTTLTFNTSTGGISVKGDSDSGYIRSRLYVANATPRHSGIYSCWYSNYSSDTVTVHVIAGENPAELHHDAVPGDEEDGEEKGEKQKDGEASVPAGTSGGISIFQRHSSFQTIGLPSKCFSFLTLWLVSWSTIWNDSWFDEPFTGSCGGPLAICLRHILGLWMLPPSACWVYSLFCRSASSFLR